MRRRPATVVFLPATAALFLLSAWMAAPSLAAPSPIVVDPSAAPDLGTLLQLISSRAWLPIAILAAVYLRHMLSDRSKLPITIPATWLPTVSAGMGLLVAALVAVQAGAPVATAVLGALVTAAATGFFDGIVTGIFGADPARVPAWARWLLALVDGLGAGGSGGQPAAIPGQPTDVVHREADRLQARRTNGVSAGSAARYAGVALVALVVGLLCFRTVPGPEQLDARTAASERAQPVLAGEGCNAQGQPNVPLIVTVTTDTLKAIACGVGVVGQDLGAVDGGSLDWPQVAIDLGETCGMDVGQIVAVFGAQSALGKAAIAHAADVHTAALRYAARASAAAGARR